MNYLGSIACRAGKAASNLTAVRAFLDLATVSHLSNVDTIVESALESGPGNDVTIALVGDSAPAAGISIVVTGTAVVVHYEAAVSTVTLLEAAIAALSGANKVIRVKTGGTGAHTIAANDAFAATALAGGSSITIRESTKNIYLMSETSGVQFEFGAGASFVTTAARAAFLAAANVVSGPFKTGGCQPVIGIWNPTGGTVTVRVYAAPGS